MNEGNYLPQFVRASQNIAAAAMLLCGVPEPVDPPGAGGLLEPPGAGRSRRRSTGKKLRIMTPTRALSPH